MSVIPFDREESLDSPQVIHGRLMEIERDLAARQNAYENVAGDWCRAQAQHGKTWATALLQSTAATVTEKKAEADLAVYGLEGTELQPEYEATKAVLEGVGEPGDDPDGRSQEPGARLMPRHGELDVSPFRELLKKRVSEGYTLTDIAFDAGFFNKSDNGGDTSRLQRAAGIMGQKNGKGVSYPPSRTVTYETAVRIVRACDRDPVDFDL